MIPAVIFLLLVAALVAKMVYDVQQFKKVKAETERLQYLAGIETPELDSPILLTGEFTNDDNQ
jgi:hypothetical protein